MGANPWMKFYPADWRADQGLRVCTLAARGLWIEMLCVMHSAVPYGHLLINGSPASDTQLAMLTGASPDQITVLIGELETAGVFSRTGKGVIYSRRMTRDEKRAALARKHGQSGGNPNLCNTTRNPPPDNPPDKGYVNGEDKAQKLEARNKNVEIQQSDPQPPVNTSSHSAPAAPGKTVAYAGNSFTLYQKEFDRCRKTYSAILDFTAALQTLDAALVGTPEGKVYQTLFARLNGMHQAALQRNRDKQPAQKSNRGRIAL